MAREDTVEIAERVFAEIAAKFPGLTMVRQPNDPVEISIKMPIQLGLKHAVWLALQNLDELHLGVEHFWLEWFPCTEPAKVSEYLNAVCGFLSGEYRILELYRYGACVKAQLQAPREGGWNTIGTWGKLHLPFPWGQRINVVSNA